MPERLNGRAWKVRCLRKEALGFESQRLRHDVGRTSGRRVPGPTRAGGDSEIIYLMLPAHYSFVTHWRIRAPLEEVWDEIFHVERWPEWWRGVESVKKIRPGNTQGAGALHEFIWKSKLPYRLTFEMETLRAERPRLIEGRSYGELEGKGVWRLEPDGDCTNLSYDWNVRTIVPWMNLLAPVLAPVFRWNHDLLMCAGEQGLKHRLERKAEND